MQLEVWCRTDRGLRRDSNQDSYLINRGLGLYVVADGMGGHSGGEVASALAVQAVEEFVAKNRDRFSSPRDMLIKAYEQASIRIFERARADSKLYGMGTTMVLCYFDGQQMFVGNVGDSRAYLFNSSCLWQVTEDHSLVNEQLRAGIINESQVKTFANKNVITRSVGYEREVAPDILVRQAQSGDHFLICSDGLSGLVPDVTIGEILSRSASDKVVDLCVDRALANGGDDNVTVMMIKIS